MDGLVMRAVIWVALSTSSAVAAVSVDSVTVVPRQEWAALCRLTVGKDDAKLCFDKIRRMISERYPAAVIRWEECRDRDAAERWGWAALMEPDKAADFLPAVKGACG